MTDIHAGGCLCGSVRYVTSGAPLLATVCHCTFCQRRTGSAFSQPVMFKAQQVALSGAALVTYEHRSDESDRWLRLEFCPRCGTTVTWTAQRRPGIRAIAGGTFDDRAWITVQKHIWTRSARHWMHLPGDVECCEKGPAD